jgi:hypothetical protein
LLGKLWKQHDRRSPRKTRPLPCPRHGDCRSVKERTMENPTRMEVVRRAYELWEQAGKPEGKDQEFYHQAEQELRNADKSSPLRTPDNL